MIERLYATAMVRDDDGEVAELLTHPVINGSPAHTFALTNAKDIVYNQNDHDGVDVDIMVEPAIVAAIEAM